MKNIVLTLCWLFVALFSHARHETVTFASPLGVPLVLSANFGELRSNHFHSGVDFKTQGRTGLNVYAVDDGYISRIAISPWGYGKALYIDHPSGYTSVYAHLDVFASFIADTIQALQYQKESFAIDTTFTPGALPVKRGMKIAVSGNTGSSGGPHLHFEIRHTATESPIDPLSWYSSAVKDNIAPEPRLLALYRHDAVAHGEQVTKATRQIVNTATNRYGIKSNFEAWGRVSLGIKAYDRMSGTSNIYGVRRVRCWVDDSLLMETLIDSIIFAETRYINSFIDYHELRSNNGSTIMRTYKMPGNGLTTIHRNTSSDGTFVIDQERTYNCKYELTDLYGNKSIVTFGIAGVKKQYTLAQPEGIAFAYKHDNEYATDEVNIYLPARALYEDINFNYSAQTSDVYYSSVHNIHTRNVPLHKPCRISMKLTCDTLPDNKYYAVCINDGKKTAVSGYYDAGWYVIDVRNWGTYAVTADTISPTITPYNREKWGSSGKISFKISDKGSGIATYRGEIDGNFCLFEYDAKRNMVVCRLTETPIYRNRSHILTMTVTDLCGNTTTTKQTIKW